MSTPVSSGRAPAEGSHQATWLPMPSVSTTSPRAAHSSANHDLSSDSADVQGWRK